MPKYETLPSDTFESIARKFYGTEQLAPFIRSANPGLAEALVAASPFPTLPPGVIIFVPEETPPEFPTTPTVDPDEVAILLDGKRFRYWTSVTVSTLLDGIGSLEFIAPFDPDSAAHREAFRPFSYKPVQLTIGGQIIFKGTLVGVTPSTGPGERTVTVGAYAIPGVLNDCTASASIYPVEFNDVNLQGIASTLAAAFGMAVTFAAPPGATFERVAIGPGQRVFPFLTGLAKQRNLVIASGANGDLVFQKSISGGSPVAQLSDALPPVISVSADFQQQQYYSSITGIEPVFVGLEGSQITVKNSRLLDAFRPFTFAVTDADSADVKAAVDAKMGRMFGGMASYSVEVTGWRDASGALWAANTIIELFAPGAMIYSPSNFIIREVSFRRTPTAKSARLTLVLPGSYDGTIPGSLPWED